MMTRPNTPSPRSPREIVFALFVAIAFVSCAEKKQPPRDEKVPVAVVRAEERTVPLQIRAVGTVQPLATVAIRAQVGGQLTRVWFKEGDDVRRGQMLFSIDPRPFQAALQQAQANLARDEAQLKNAEAERARYAELVTKDYVTRQEYDRVVAAAEAARAVVAANRAAIENARLQLAYCEIRSPIDGRTGSLVVHGGNLVRANDTTPLVTINQIQPVNVQFSVPEAQLTELRNAGGSGLAVSATPQGGAVPAVGRVTFLDNAVDAATGTISLKASFPNDDRRLWPGQFVTVAITVTNRENSVVLPAQAVQTGQRGQYVYVVKSDQGVEMRPVSVFRQIDQQVIIEKGVSAGETVVTDGQLRLTPKSKVEVKTAL